MGSLQTALRVLSALSDIELEQAVSIARILLQTGEAEVHPDALHKFISSAGSNSATSEFSDLLPMAAVALAALPLCAGGPCGLVTTCFTSVLLPLLAWARDGRTVTQVQQQISNVLASTNNWTLAASLLAACLPGQAASADDCVTAVAALSAGQRILLATELVQQALQCRTPQRLEPLPIEPLQQETEASPHTLLLYAAKGGFAAALAQLCSAHEAPAARRAIGRHLLPACLQAAERCSVGLRACVQQLWQATKQLTAIDSPTDLRVGLAIIVQFGPTLLHDGRIWQDEHLWLLLRGTLRDADGLQCKRAMHVLRAAVVEAEQAAAAGRHSLPAAVLQPWAAATFFRLWDVLDEFSIHLIREALPEMDSLHPPALQHAEADSLTSTPLDWTWLCVLWAKGLTHVNQHVQRLAAISFLTRSWQPAYLRSIPVSFVCTTLLPTLGQANVLEKQEEGQELDILGLACAFVASYCAALSKKQQRELLHSLLKLLAGSKSLQLVKLAAEAAAGAAEAAGLSLLVSKGGAEAEGRELMALLSDAAHAQRQMGAGSMGQTVFKSLLRVAGASVSVSSPELLLAAGRWLQAFPLGFLQPGGQLRAPAVTWVAEASAALPRLVQSYIQAPSLEGSPSAGGLARLLLLQEVLISAEAPLLSATGGTSQLVAAALQPLDGSLSGLYRRAHQQQHTTHLALLLLKELLLALEPLPCLQQQGTPAAACALHGWLVQLLAGREIVEELCSYSRLAIERAFFAERSQQQHSSSCDSPAVQFDSDNTSAAALSVWCVCGALRVLIREPQKETVWQVLQQLCSMLAWLITVYQNFSASSSSSTGTLLGIINNAARALAVAADTGEYAAKAQLSLQHALQATLQHQAAAAAAAGSQAVKADQTQSTATASSRCLRLSWYAAAGLLQLQASLESQGAAAKLCHSLQAQLLIAAVQGVAASKRDLQSLMPQLHCIRALLPALVANGQDGVSSSMQDEPSQQLPLLQEPAIHAAVGSAGATDLAAALTWVFSALWKALQGASKVRRTSLMANFLSASLHPALFAVRPADDPRWSLHAPSGPIQKYACHLLSLGSRSSRLQALVAAQLCGLLVANPAVAPMYSKSSGSDASILEQLVLYGAEQALGTASNDGTWEQESAAELASVLKPIDPDLAAAFAATDLAPRVTAVCMLGAWVRSAREGDAAAAAAGSAAWQLLLQLATHDKELSSSKYVLNGQTHRKKVRVWQALCVLCPLLSAAEAEQGLATLLSALSVVNSPTVRQFQEAICLQLVMHKPALLRSALLRSALLPLLQDYRSSKPGVAVDSLVLIAAQAVVLLQPAHHPHTAQCHQQDASSSASVLAARKHAAARGPDARQQQQEQQWEQEQTVWNELLRDVTLAITPWALCHPHHTRTFAQLMVDRLCQLYPALLLTDPTMTSLVSFLRTNEDLERLRKAAGAESVLTDYRLAQATSPTGVFCEGVKLLGKKEDAGVYYEGAPQPLLAAIIDLLHAERSLLRQRMATDEAERAQADISRSMQQCVKAAADTAKRGASEQQQQQQQTTGANWQRKITPLDRSMLIADAWSAALGLPALAAASGSRGIQATHSSSATTDSVGLSSTADIDLEAAAQEMQSRRVGAPRQQLVVCASLIDKLPNLAGLARTCEVFRASMLVMSDLSVCAQREFSSISVTAEQHLPMAEVAEAALPAWLSSKVAEGYTLVGLEQTAESHSLPSFQFPAKTVLVLGREKEGIPAELLEQLHCTVEIPQLGLIRSLNVHVSSAISIYSYTVQHDAAARS